MIDVLSKPSFVAHKNNVGQNTIADNTWTKLTATTAASNVGGYYDTTNSKWTPPAGKIFLNGLWYASTGTIGTGGACAASFYKNGSVLFYMYSAAVVNSPWGRVYCLDTCTGADYYEFWGYADLTGTALNTWDCSGDPTLTKFSGHWISQ